jgi:hypothetical protein
MIGLRFTTGLRLSFFLIAATALVAGAASIRAAELPAVSAARQATAACGPVQPEKSVSGGFGAMNPAVFEVIGGGVLCVKGQFYYDSSKKIEAIPDPSAIKTMVIDSGGGFVLPAIELARMAERYGWLIVVSNNCYSSCANYVFLADTEKIVLPNSFVSWHGLPVSAKEATENFDKYFAANGGMAGLAGSGLTREEFRRYTVDSAVESEKFFAAHGISEDLARAVPKPDAKFSKAYAEELSQALAAGKINWAYSRHALIEHWKVPKILYMWQPKDREAETLAFKQRNGWWLFFFN